MKNVKLGKTGIIVPQNGFGALPVQRCDAETAVKILRSAKEGGMVFFDTAHSYSDSEEKIGLAFGENGMRDDIILATKTPATTPEGFWADLELSLKRMKTDHVDLYQFHMVSQCYRPGDGTGMYECMEEAKAQGKIRHIGITTHKIGVAQEIVESGLYETLQFPFSYLADPQDLELVELCRKADMGFIAMKGLAGGLITDSEAAMAFMTQFDHVIPIWGIQRMSELEEWLSYMEETPTMNERIAAFIENEKKELAGDFCRGCGYCMPCPQGIKINNCARMILMLRRASSASWLSEEWQAEMKKIETCLHCNKCSSHCPYGLNTPALLEKNYEDYKRVLAGEANIS